MPMSVTRRVGRLRHRVSRRFTSGRPIMISSVRYEYGFGFGDLYHPYTEVLAAGSVPEGAKILESFYDSMEAWRRGLSDGEALPVQAWRYAQTRRRERLTSRIPSAHFGRIAEEGTRQALTRTEHLFELRDSIEREGYRPGAQKIDGVWVGDTFLILGGQNRVAVLAHLGWDQVKAHNYARHNTPKRLVAEKLPLVRSGDVSVAEAQSVVGRIERGFSRADATAAGFPFATRPGGGGRAQV